MLELIIVTINTWKCDGHYRRRINLLKEQLLQLNPSIIACQEVFHCEDNNTVQSLAEALNMDFIYTPSREKMRIFEGKKVNSQSGLGLISKFPIEIATSLELPMDARDGERKAQFSILRVNDYPLLIINTHLSHLKDAEPLRKEQLKTILGHSFLNASYETILLCGDFNSEEKDDAIQYLLSQNKFSVKNCYSEAKGKLPHYTRLAQSAISGHKEGKCIDFIFSIENGSNSVVAINASTVLNIPDNDGVYPSDHYGVMATLGLKSQVL